MGHDVPAICLVDITRDCGHDLLTRVATCADHLNMLVGQADRRAARTDVCTECGAPARGLGARTHDLDTTG